MQISRIRFFAIATFSLLFCGSVLYAQNELGDIDELGSSDATPAVDRYLEMLSDSRFQQRELATRKLAEIGESAIPRILSVALESEDLEVISRAFLVLRKSADGPSIDEVLGPLEPVLNGSGDYNRIVRRFTQDLFASVENRIVRQLQILGVKVRRDSQRFVVRIDLDDDWRGRDEDLSELRRLKHVTTIDCEKSIVSDPTVRYLAKVPNLNKLYLGNCNVTGDGLKSLEGHTKIRYLSLINQSLNESAYDSLAKMTWLTHLGLDETSTTDAQLAKLKELTELDTLWLTNSNVTDEGLIPVAGFKKLHRIVLAGTKVQGSGLRHLRSLPLLSIVDLSKTEVGDLGLWELFGAAHLSRLKLQGSRVTDISLETILSFKELNRLYIGESMLSDESTSVLGALLPYCELRTVPAE